MSGRVRVIIVDDHTLVREGISRLLATDEEIELIGEGQDGLEAVHLAQSLSPDVMLIDINMPKMGGIEAARQIKNIAPEIKVLMLTIYEDEEYIQKALKVGADGYLQKEVSSQHLRRTVKQVAGGGLFFPQDIRGDLLNYKTSAYNGGLESNDQLTRREEEVLELLAKGASNKEIADELFISEKTVKNHVSSILRKFSVNDRTQAVIFALKKGMVRLT
ncbi:MAG: response regulator transcription factor [Halanaerobium sp.]|nr:response regulator transcription factor [Halanaerobium sp.]